MQRPPSVESIEVIRSCTLSDREIVLPARKLPKALYSEVKRVLNALGGEWSTSAQAFVFDYEYADRLHSVLSGRENLPERNPTAFFPTQAETANSAVGKSLGLKSVPIGARMLEPNAGRAALIDAVLAVRPDLTVEAAEIDPFHRQFLQQRGVKLIGSDFLSVTADRYHVIVMNPPFAVDGDKFAWISHVEKALDLLLPGGVLIAILPDAASWRSTGRVQNFRERVTAMGGVFEKNPKDAFKASGTMTATCTLYLGAIDTPEARIAAKEVEGDIEFEAAPRRLESIVPSVPDTRGCM